MQGKVDLEQWRQEAVNCGKDLQATAMSNRH